MQLGIRGDFEGSLAVRLTWLTALRLLVLTVFLVVTGWVYTGGFVPGGFSSRFALVTVTTAYVVAGIYAVLLRRGRALRAVSYAQLVTDQITWSAIVYITGGATSGATSLYGLTCLSGAILIGLRGAMSAALAATLSYFALCAALATQLLHPPADQLAAYALGWAEMAYPLFVNVLAIGVVALLASYLAERLKAAGGKLAVVTARAEEAERLAALGRLAAGLAHEIRNPLGSIAGSIELLRTGGALSAEDRKLCEIIEREAARLNDLISDLLDLARPRDPQKRAVDLAATARDVVTLAAKSGRGGDVGLRYEGPTSALVVADAAQMRQLVWNLVRNGVQASSAGDDVVVSIAPSEGGGGYVLGIGDRGRGIPPEARERLFDAFFSTRSQGVGIGLAVVKRIIDDHGFTIEVDSVEGEGTTFRVQIPRPSADALDEVRVPTAASVMPPRL